MRNANATTAAVLQNGRLVGYAHTVLPSGLCCWGYELLDGGAPSFNAAPAASAARKRGWKKSPSVTSPRCT